MVSQIHGCWHGASCPSCVAPGKSPHRRMTNHRSFLGTFLVLALKVLCPRHPDGWSQYLWAQGFYSLNYTDTAGVHVRVRKIDKLFRCLPVWRSRKSDTFHRLCLLSRRPAQGYHGAQRGYITQHKWNLHRHPQKQRDTPADRHTHLEILPDR